MSNWTCTIQELADATGGKVLAAGTDRFSRVGTDSRVDLSGQLFVALNGENFNAHDFVAAAVAKGAAVVLVHEWRDEWKQFTNNVGFVQVPDTLKALQAFALHWRRKHKFTVVAVTGSNGKTTTKEFTSKILQKKFSVHASKGSFNNHWGVPLSILQAGSGVTHLILEMGMNHAGEISHLCKIAEPDIVTVTTVGRAHIGELGSQESVATAKEEIYVACPRAIHVFNIDNEWTQGMFARSQAKKITFSAFNPQADIHFRAQRMTWQGLDLVGHIRDVAGSCLVRVLGRQNTINLMAAAGLAAATGMTEKEIWVGLGEIHETAWGRNQLLELKMGAKILFDAYNANPDSMLALLKNLYEMDFDGRKFLVVGDMRELGDFTEAAHEETGERAGNVGFYGIWYIGANGEAFAKGLNKGGRPVFFRQSKDVDAAIADEFLQLLGEGDLVAVKASRGMALERVIKGWPLTEPLGSKP